MDDKLGLVSSDFAFQNPQGQNPGRTPLIPPKQSPLGRSLRVQEVTGGEPTPESRRLNQIEERESQMAFLQQVRESVKSNPKTAARADALGVQLGMEAHLVEGNMEAAEQLMTEQRISNLELARFAPILFAEVHYPGFLKQSWDDLETLSILERIPSQFSAGFAETALHEAATRYMNNPSSFTTADLNDLAYRQAQLDAVPHDSGWTSGFRALGQFAATSLPNMAIGVAAGAVAGASGVGAAAVPHIVFWTTTALSTFDSYETEAGAAFLEYRRAGIPFEVARDWANRVGFANAAVEGGLGYVLKFIPGAGKFIAGNFEGQLGKDLLKFGAQKLSLTEVGKRLISDGLTRPKATRRWAVTFSRYMAQIGVEWSEEMIQNPVTEVGKMWGVEESQRMRDQNVGLIPGWFSLPNGDAVRTNEDGSIDVSARTYKVLTGRGPEGGEGITVGVDLDMGSFVTLQGDQKDLLLRNLDESFPLMSAFNSETILSDVGTMWAQSAYTMLKAVWIAPMAGPLMQHAAEGRRNTRAKVLGEVLFGENGVEEKVTKSRLRQNNNAKFVRLLKEMWRGKTLERMVIARDKLEEAMSSTGVTVERLAEVLPEVALQLGLDAAEQPFIEIDGAEFFNTLSETPLMAAVMTHVKPTPDESSLAEAAEGEKVVKERSAKLQKDLKEDEKLQKEFDEQLDEVEQETLKAFSDSKAGVTPEHARMAAAMHRRFIDQKARKRGLMPKDITPIKVDQLMEATVRGQLKQEGKDVGFKLSEVDEKEGRVLVEIDPDVLDETLEQDPSSYVGPQGEGGIEGRYQQFEAFFDYEAIESEEGDIGRGPGGKFEGDLVEAPTLVLNDEGKPVIENGRHRLAVLRDRGERVFASVLPGEVIELTRQGVVPVYEEDTLPAPGALPTDETTNKLRQELSTRVPTGKDAKEDALEEVLVVDVETALDAVNDKTTAKSAETIRNLPFMRIKRGSSDKQVVEQFIQHMVSNLEYLYQEMTPAERRRSRRWYDGGRKYVEAWANRYGLSTMQTAAVIAVLSPQKNWFVNMTMAERILDIHAVRSEMPTTDEMLVKSSDVYTTGATKGKIRIPNPNPKKMPDGLKTHGEVVEAIRGKTLNQLVEEDPLLAAYWVRLYDYTYNENTLRMLSPEGGAAGTWTTTIQWGSYDTIAKVLSVLKDGSKENVSKQLGAAHKVRSFYNNLFAPNSKRGNVTIDTHAVAAALMIPVSSKHTYVTQAWGGAGGPSNSDNGIMGFYPFYAEAVRRVAKNHKMLPREIQSITWEEIRALMSDKDKRTATVAQDMRDKANEELKSKSGLTKAEQVKQEAALVETEAKIEELEEKVKAAEKKALVQARAKVKLGKGNAKQQAAAKEELAKAEAQSKTKSLKEKIRLAQVESLKQAKLKVARLKAAIAKLQASGKDHAEKTESLAKAEAQLTKYETEGAAIPGDLKKLASQSKKLAETKAKLAPATKAVRAASRAEIKRADEEVDLPLRAEAVWFDYHKGRITLDEARERIEKVFGGRDPKFWVDISEDQPLSRTYSGPAAQEVDARGDLGRAQEPVGVSFEVKPNLNPALMAQWDSLSEEEKAAAATYIIQNILPMVLKEAGYNGDVQTQRGAWDKSVEQSFAVVMDDPDGAVAVADLLGAITYQQGMSIMSKLPGKDLKEQGAIFIELPAGMSVRGIDQLYLTRLLPLLEGILNTDGEVAIRGHTSADGFMTLGVDGDIGMTLAELSGKIQAVLPGTPGAFKVTGDDVYSALRKAGTDYEIRESQRGDASQSSSEQGSVSEKLRTRADRVYAAGIARAKRGRGDRGRQRLRQLGDEVDGDSTADTGEQAEAGEVQDAGGVRGSDELLDESAGSQPGAAGVLPGAAREKPLAGLPATVEVDGKEVAFGPSGEARQVAREYAEEAGIPYSPPGIYVAINEETSQKIADTYEAMENAPNDPAVQAAYEALAQETVAQYRALMRTGLVVEFMPTDEDGNFVDPYGNPRNALVDIAENNHFYVFSTEGGFGEKAITPEQRAENPMLRKSGFLIDGKPALVNDIFRVVHDYFGHFKEGVGFRARGEENAWQQHMAMFSPLARRALTTETRGQNTWVNFGPDAKHNSTASPTTTVYAEQKMLLLPLELSEAGYEGGGMARLRSSDARGTFDTKTLTIELGREHDVTTLMHEMMHFHIEETTIAFASNTASADEIQDLNTFAKMAGYDGIMAFATASFKDRVKGHEFIAYSFEQYLYDNKVKASDPEIRAAFRRLSRKFVEVYQGVRDVIAANYASETKSTLPRLSPEVTALFDRMLLAEEEIESRMRQDAIGRLLLEESADPDAKGKLNLRPGDEEILEELLFNAEGEAKEKLRAALLKELALLQNYKADLERGERRRYADKRKQVRAEAQSELLSSSQVARLQYWLETGWTVNDEGQPNVGDTKESVDERGQKVVSEDPRIPKKRRTKDITDGVSEAELAMMFGYDAVDEMLSSLDQALPLSEEVDLLADERMLAEFSELSDPKAVKDRVDAAVNNKAMVRLHAAEAAILEGNPKGASEVLRTVQAVARDVVDNLTTGDLKGTNSAPARYSRAATAAERQARMARSRRDVEAMRRHQRVALMQRALAQEAYARRDALRQLATSINRTAAYRGKEREKVASRTYGGATLNTVREILLLIGIGRGAPTRASTDDWTPYGILRDEDPLKVQLEIALEGSKRMVGDAGVNAMLVKDAMQYLIGAQGVLMHGRKLLSFVVADRKLLLEQAIDQLNKQADDEGFVKRSVEEVSRWKSTKRGISKFIARSQRFEALIRALDGGKVGLLSKLILEPIYAAANNAQEQETEVLTRLAEILKPLRDQVNSDSALTKPLTASILTRANGAPSVFLQGKLGIIGAMLHAGTWSNLARLLKGEEWAAPVDGVMDFSVWERQMAEWESQGIVTEADWAIVKQIWAVYDELLPQVQDSHYEIMNYEMGVMQRREVRTKWGMVKGGYVPAYRDVQRLTTQGQRHQADDMLEWLASIPAVNRGSTKERVDEIQNDPLDLDPINQALHFHKSLVFIHMGPVYRKLQSLVNNRDFMEVMDRLHPDIMVEHVQPWLHAAATLSTTLPDAQQSDLLGQHAQWVNSMRRNVGNASMFSRVVNSVQGYTGVALGASLVPAKWLLHGGLFGGKELNWTQLYKKSTFMRNRHRQGASPYEARGKVLALHDSSNRVIRGFQKTSRWANENTYWMQEIFQKPVDRLVWRAAYLRAMDEHGNEKDAIYEADSAVRLTQSDSQALDMSRVEKGGTAAKLFTQFSSWFLTLGSLRAIPMRKFAIENNLDVTEGRSTPAQAALNVKRFVLTVALSRQAITAFATLYLGEVVAEMFKAEHDDEEDLLDQQGRMLATSLISLPRALGPVGGAGSAILATLLNGENYQQRMPAPPVISALLRTVKTTYGVFVDKPQDKLSKEITDSLEMLISLVTGIPVHVVTRRIRQGLDPFGEDPQADTYERIMGGITGR